MGRKCNDASGPFISRSCRGNEVDKDPRNIFACKAPPPHVVGYNSTRLRFNSRMASRQRACPGALWFAIANSSVWGIRLAGLGKRTPGKRNSLRSQRSESRRPRRNMQCEGGHISLPEYFGPASHLTFTAGNSTKAQREAS